MNDAVNFKKYLDSRAKGEYSNMRLLIAKRCDVSNATISFWLSGRTKIPYLAKKEIEKIAKQKIFEI